jgi:lauroyl/myristoyl acyltransferase
MTGAIENAGKDFKARVKKVVYKITLWTPLNSYLFSFVLVISTFWNAYVCRKKIVKILRYKKAIKNSQKNIVFLFNYFLNKTYDTIFIYLITENPKKYLKYICIEGEEYMSQLKLMDNDRGVILITGHFDPEFRTLLFKEVFGIGISSFMNADNKKKFYNSSKKQHKIICSFPIYSVGEEKQLVEGLLRKEWIIFLNDVPVKKRGFRHYTLFGKNINFSELPFKLSIKYNIPMLFLGTTRIKRQYLLSILPIDEFYTKEEGVERYTALIEKFLCHDPYAINIIAEEYLDLL